MAQGAERQGTLLCIPTGPATYGPSNLLKLRSQRRDHEFKSRHMGVLGPIRDPGNNASRKRGS